MLLYSLRLEEKPVTETMIVEKAQQLEQNLGVAEIICNYSDRLL